MSQKKTTAGIAAAALLVTGATLGLTSMVESQTATTASSTASTGSSDQQGTTVSVSSGNGAPQASTSGS